MTGSRRPSSRAQRTMRLMGLLLFAGALIWIRLRLVTNVPRTAYAQPEVPPAAQRP